jgi:hypothetical protein
MPSTRTQAEGSGSILHFDKLSVLSLSMEAAAFRIGIWLGRRYQQFCTILYMEASKTGKKLDLETDPDKFEFRLLIVGADAGTLELTQTEEI